MYMYTIMCFSNNLCAAVCYLRALYLKCTVMDDSARMHYKEREGGGASYPGPVATMSVALFYLACHFRWL